MVQTPLLNKIFFDVVSSNDASSHFKKVTLDYPYFGLAHFYNLKNDNAEDLINGKTAAKTALFFTSNFYLQSQFIAEATQPVTPDLK